jgi:integrase/recombinase XerD
MLNIYRRHKKNCEHRTEGRKYRRCRCPLWVDGIVGGKEVRKSLGTANWEKGNDKVREWEFRESEPLPAPEPITIQLAQERLLADMAAQKLAESTIVKYRQLFKQMNAFAQDRGLRYLDRDWVTKNPAARLKAPKVTLCPTLPYTSGRDAADTRGDG